MKKEILWWLFGLTVFGLIFFPGMTIIMLVGSLYLIGPIVVIGLICGFIGGILDHLIKQCSCHLTPPPPSPEDL